MGDSKANNDSATQEARAKDHAYVTFLDKWELEVGGIIDDCIEETLDWYKEEGIAV